MVGADTSGLSNEEKVIVLKTDNVDVVAKNLTNESDSQNKYPEFDNSDIDEEELYKKVESAIPNTKEAMLLVEEKDENESDGEPLELSDTKTIDSSYDGLFNRDKLDQTIKNLQRTYDEMLVQIVGSKVEEAESRTDAKKSRGELNEALGSAAQENRRLFENCLNKLSFRFSELELNYTNKLNDFKQLLTISRKEKDNKVIEWKDRYEKLQNRWNDIMNDMENLQREKEDLRIERDSLYMGRPLLPESPKAHVLNAGGVRFEKQSHTSFTGPVDTSFNLNPLSTTVEFPVSTPLLNQGSFNFVDSGLTIKTPNVTVQWQDFKQSKELKDMLQKQRVENLRLFAKQVLLSMSESIDAMMGTVFLINPKSNELQSFCLVCKYDFGNPSLSELIENKSISTSNQYSNTSHLLSEGPKAAPKSISVPISQGIVGEVFTKETALNLFDVATYKKHYKMVDRETGLKTKVALCYPLYSKKTNTCIGVLQMMNKCKSLDFPNDVEPFDIQDEAKMTEFSKIFSDILDSEAENLPFSHYVKPQQKERISVYSTKKNTEILTDISKTINTTNLVRIYGPNTSKVFDDLDETTNQFSKSQVTGRPSNALVPKDVEEYIKNLEACWRRAVSDTAQHKNNVLGLEAALEEKKVKIKVLEDLVAEKQKTIDELNGTLMSEFKDKKQSKQEWNIKENEMRIQLDFIKKTHNTLVQEHMIRLKEDSIKSLLLPVNNPTNDLSLLRTSQEKKVLLPYLDPKLKNKKNGKQKPIPNEISDRTTTVFQPIFSELFTQLPLPAIILTKKFRIWRFNSRFLHLVGCQPENEIFLSQILGMVFSDICVGIEPDNLSKLMQYDILQGLALTKFSPGEDGNTSVASVERSDSRSSSVLSNKKSFVKVTAFVSRIGQPGQKFSGGLGTAKVSVSPSEDSYASNSAITGPLFSIVFTK